MNSLDKSIFYQCPSIQMSHEAPIFITGAHRSGTTWTASMLAQAHGTLMTEEPFNVQPHRYSLDGLANDYFAYVPGMLPEQAFEAFEKILDSKTGRIFSRRSPQRYLSFTRKARLIIKDPIACMSSDWLSENFNLNTIMMVRHPAAFAASLQRVGWDPDISAFLKQKALVDDHLYDLLPLLEKPPSNFVERCGLMWKIIYQVLNSYQDLHPEWIVCRHEDLAMHPQLAFKCLYQTLGLEWTDEVSAKIREHTEARIIPSADEDEVHMLKRNSRSSIDGWKSVLSARDTAALKRITSPEWELYYDEESWN